MAEQERCPTCGSINRSSFRGKCGFRMHDPWHDQPAVPSKQGDAPITGNTDNQGRDYDWEVGVSIPGTDRAAAQAMAQRDHERLAHGAAEETRAENLPGLFNLYTRAHRGLIFSKRLQVVKAMEDAMLEAESVLKRQEGR